MTEKKSLWKFPILLLILFILYFGAATQAQNTPTTSLPKGKNPVIIIPGLTGSELINSKTNETVWFKPQRSKDDDIRLPISTNLARNRDNLIAGDIIRAVKFLKFLPESEIYEKLIGALEEQGGYKEGHWDTPLNDGFEDTFYIFSYDWRRDNVENARLLIQKIEALKRKLGKPNLKFNIIAHSMGGLIARYAAMYGNRDLSAARPRPNWAGAKDFDKIFLLGTPNEGSIRSLEALLNGFSYVGGGLNLPFIQNLSRFDIFTLPSIYQLLPHQGTLSIYDENLKPLEVKLYDVKTWENYGWGIWQDDDFKNKLSLIEQKNAKGFFTATLLRAARFQAALDVETSGKLPVSFYLIGSECRDTPNGAVIYRDKKDRWKIIFKPDSFERSNGEKVSSEELKTLIFAGGDGVVTKRSLKAETRGNSMTFPINSEIIVCEGHTKLITSSDVQSKLLTLLVGETAK